MTTVAVASTTASVDAPPRRQPVSGSRLAVHAAGLLLLLLAVLPFAANGDQATTDEGATLSQLDALARTGHWGIAHPASEFDPSGDWFPVPDSQRDGDAWFPLAKHPAAVAMLLPAYEIGGERGVVLVHLVALVLTALLAALITRRLAPGRELLALWLAGVGSPMIADSFLVTSHAAGTAFAALAAFGAVALLERHGGPAWFLGLCVTIGAATTLLALVRNEGVLFAIGLAAALCLATWRTRRWALLTGAAASVGGAALGYVGTHAWAMAIAGNEAQAFRVREDVAWLSGRMSGFVASIVQPGSATTSDALPGLLVGLAFTVVVIAGVRLRRRVDDRPAVVLLAVAVVAGFAALILGAPAVSGILPAAPALVLGFLQLRRADVRPPASELLVATIVVFFGLVIATQYSDGGGLQWGGRYLHLAVPAAVPLAAIGLGNLFDAWRGVGTFARVRPAGSVVAVLIAVPALLVVSSMHEVRSVNGASVRSVDDLVTAEAAAGHPPVLVYDGFTLGRLGWEFVTQRPSLNVAMADWERVSTVLSAAGVDDVVVATTEPESQVVDRFDDFEVERSGWNAPGTLRLVVLRAAR